MSGFSQLRLEGVTRRFGTADALSGLDLTIERGEFIALLGPSGCGKSTALNCLAGLLPLTAGAIWQDDKQIDTLPPEKRGFGMVFQNYALFPHLTVRDNIAFGLRMRHLSKDDVRRRTTEAIEMVQLIEHASKLPGQLSGGQQQRVAIARATVLEPSLVLMDEPLSNLDAKLRLEMRTEIRRLHQSLGLTTVYVTHDQEEALSMADRLVVMRQGKVQQVGTPEEVHTKPSTWHVADFMGYRNLLPLKAKGVTGDQVTVDLGGTAITGTAQGTVATGDDVIAAVRPEDVKLGDGAVNESAVNEGAANDGAVTDAVVQDRAASAGVKALVEVVEYQGRERAVEVVLDNDVRLHVRTEQRVEVGEQVALAVTPGRLLVYPS